MIFHILVNGDVVAVNYIYKRLVSPTSIHIEPVEMCEGLGLAFCEGSGA